MTTPEKKVIGYIVLDKSGMDPRDILWPISAPAVGYANVWRTEKTALDVLNIYKDSLNYTDKQAKKNLTIHTVTVDL